MTHTPTPWELQRPCMSDPHNEHSYDIFTPTHDGLGSCHHVGEIDLNSAEPAVANAEHIIRAVNSFDELLRHLRLILEVSDRNDAATYRQAVREIAESAIAKAEASPT